MAKDIRKILGTVEDLLDRGATERARTQLLPLFNRRIPREHLVHAARISRKAQLPDKAVKLLNRVIRPLARQVSDATDAEKCEYAADLTAIGATREAIQLFSTLNPARLPRLLPHYAYACFRIWDWDRAIPLLDLFLKLGEPELPIRLDGQLSLASALLHGRRECDRAWAILEEVRAAASGPEELRYIHMQALQLQIQVRVVEGRWKDARKLLGRLEEECGRAEHPIFRLRARQWHYVIELKTAAPGSAGQRAALQDLRGLRAGYREGRYWEFGRSCDYYGAIVTRDPELLNYVYFGSPFPALRQRLLKETGLSESALPETYLWRLGDAPGKPVRLRAATGENSQGPEYLKEGQIPQRLLESLCSDFYKPQRVSELHERLYPEQYFNPHSSPARVHQALQRLRAWLARNRISITIRERNEAYELTSAIACEIELRRGAAGPGPARAPVLTSKLKGMLGKLREKFPNAEFSAGDAARVLRISQRSAARYLKYGKDGRVVIQTGKGPRSRYRLPPAG